MSSMLIERGDLEARIQPEQLDELKTDFSLQSNDTALNEYQDALTCPICCERYKGDGPRMAVAIRCDPETPVLHCICRLCTLNISLSNPDQPLMDCPVCKTSCCTPVSKFPTMNIVNNIVDTGVGKKRCRKNFEGTDSEGTGFGDDRQIQDLLSRVKKQKHSSKVLDVLAIVHHDESLVEASISQWLKIGFHKGIDVPYTCKILTSTMGRYLSSPGILVRCILAFGWISFTQDNRKVICDKGGIEIIVQAMKENPTHAELQSNASALISSMAMHENIGQRIFLVRKIAGAGAVGLLVKALANHKDDRTLHQRAFGALGKFLVKNVDCPINMTEKEGEEILLSMKRFSDSKSITGDGCKIILPMIINLRACWKNQETYIPLITETIVGAMESFPDREGIQILGSAAINMFASKQEDVNTIISKGGVRAVLVAMECQAESSQIQRFGNDIFNRIGSDENHIKLIMDDGGVELVIKGMRNHPENACLQKCFLYFLTMMASVTGCKEVYGGMFMGFDALGLVKSILDRHSSDADVQLAGAECIKALYDGPCQM